MKIDKKAHSHVWSFISHSEHGIVEVIFDELPNFRKITQS